MNAATPKKKIKAQEVSARVPQTVAEVNDAIREIGVLDRELARLNIGFQDAAAKVKETHETLALPVAQTRNQLVKAVQAYCDANRKSLTDNGRHKTAVFAAGSATWRLRPPRCTLPKDLSAIVQFLKDNRLSRFIRVSEDVSKEMLLADPETALKIPGVKIGSAGEDFAVEPYTSESLEAAQ